VFLGNVVDDTYTGVYHVDVTIHFYPFVEKSFGDGSNSKVGALAFGGGVPADLVLPISRNLPLNDGLWFVINNSTDVGLKEFRVPQNAYRAVLEVYVSFHERDEFWYTNPPDDILVPTTSVMCLGVVLLGRLWFLLMGRLWVQFGLLL